MRIASTIKTAKQLRLLFSAAILSILIATVVILFQWVQANTAYTRSFEGYADKAAYDRCLAEVDSTQYRNDYGPFVASLACKDKWGIWKKVKKPPTSFASIVTRHTGDILGVIAVMTAGIYLLLSSISLYLNCEHLGWRRLAILLSFAPSVLIGYLVLSEAGAKVSTEEMFMVALAAATGYVAGIFTTLGSRRLVLWVKEGFDSPA